MNSDADAPVDVGTAFVEDLRVQIQALQQEISDLRGATDGDGQRSITIITTKGTLGMAHPPFILVGTATAFGWDIVVFHTFWGLDILHEKRSKNLKLSAVGSPSIPMPSAVAALPFMDSVATSMTKEKIQKSGTATAKELIETSLDMDVDLQACQMTIELTGYDGAELYDSVITGVGVAMTLQHMADTDVQPIV